MLRRAGDASGLVAVGERGHNHYSDDGVQNGTQASVPGVGQLLTGVDLAGQPRVGRGAQWRGAAQQATAGLTGNPADETGIQAANLAIAGIEQENRARNSALKLRAR